MFLRKKSAEERGREKDKERAKEIEERVSERESQRKRVENVLKIYRKPRRSQNPLKTLSNSAEGCGYQEGCGVEVLP